MQFDKDLGKWYLEEGDSVFAHGADLVWKNNHFELVSIPDDTEIEYYVNNEEGNYPVEYENDVPKDHPRFLKPYVAEYDPEDGG